MSKIRDSARGEECQVRIPMVCCHDPETTILAHGAGSDIKGIGQKTDDLISAYCCFTCHNVLDRRQPAPNHMTREDVELCFWRGHARTLLKLKAKGLV